MSFSELSADEKRWRFADLIRTLTELIGQVVAMGMDPLDAHRMTGAVLSFVIEPLGMQQELAKMQELQKSLEAFTSSAKKQTTADEDDAIWPDDLAAAQED